MNMELLSKMLTAYGPSGREGRVAAVIREALAGHVDTLETDAMGNLIAVKKGDGTGRRVMTCAHMDHIALAVTDADENGFLRVCGVGGVYPQKMVGGHVAFENGVGGVIGADETAKEPQEVSDLYVDIGAESREEALERVQPGDMCVMQPRVTQLGAHRLSSPAMDDRIACYIQVQALLEAQSGNEIIAVFSVQEEEGVGGAGAAAYAMRPDWGIAVDVTGTGDVPKVKAALPVKLGAGAAIKIMDRSLICSPSVVALMERLAKENGIAHQREVLPYGGTDAAAIQRTRGGIPCGAISIPCRYVHTAAETVDLRDVEACVALLKACLKA